MAAPQLPAFIVEVGFHKPCGPLHHNPKPARLVKFGLDNLVVEGNKYVFSAGRGFRHDGDYTSVSKSDLEGTLDRHNRAAAKLDRDTEVERNAVSYLAGDIELQSWVAVPRRERSWSRASVSSCSASSSVRRSFT